MEKDRLTKLREHHIDSEEIYNRTQPKIDEEIRDDTLRIIRSGQINGTKTKGQKPRAPKKPRNTNATTNGTSIKQPQHPLPMPTQQPIAQSNQVHQTQTQSLQSQVHLNQYHSPQPGTQTVTQANHLNQSHLIQTQVPHQHIQQSHPVYQQQQQTLPPHQQSQLVAANNHMQPIYIEHNNLLATQPQQSQQQIPHHHHNGQSQQHQQHIQNQNQPVYQQQQPMQMGPNTHVNNYVDQQQIPPQQTYAQASHATKTNGLTHSQHQQHHMHQQQQNPQQQHSQQQIMVQHNQPKVYHQTHMNHTNQIHSHQQHNNYQAMKREPNLSHMSFQPSLPNDLDSDLIDIAVQPGLDCDIDSVINHENAIEVRLDFDAEFLLTLDSPYQTQNSNMNNNYQVHWNGPPMK